MTRRTVIRAAFALGLVGSLHALDFVTVLSPHLWQLHGLRDPRGPECGTSI